MTIHRLYTRRGDQGQTSLAGGQRVSKSDLRVEAYGTVDELNSFLGLLVTYLSDHDAQCVEQVQHALFQVGASLATPYASVDDIPPIPSTLATTLEQEMDRMSALLPERHGFTIPGGNRAAATAHVCCTVCRRAERRVVALAAQEAVSPSVLQLLNRLSDYLFQLALYLHVDKH